MNPAVFHALMAHGRLAKDLCEFAASGRWVTPMVLAEICESLRRPRGNQTALDQLLNAGRVQQIFVEERNRWRPAAGVSFETLGHWIEGGLMQQDASDIAVDVVLTFPPEPSRFIKTLRESLKKDTGLRRTEELLPTIASQAKNRAIIVSPFIDAYGIDRVTNFFDQTPARERHLIVRKDKPGVENALAEARHNFSRLDVAIHHYHFPLEEHGNESFHAKIVLADRDVALVGSSNMTKWSMTYSLELGLLVQGAPASRVADVVEAILGCSDLA